MNDGSLKTLFHPFESGLLEPPGTGTKGLFLNADPDFRLPDGFAASFVLQQDSRPAFRKVEAAGHHVVPQPEGEDYDLALVLCGRHRGRNELWLAEALGRVRSGGRVIVAGGKTEGAASLRKRVADLCTVDGHASKNHGVVFWITRSPQTDAAADALRQANPPLLLEGGFLTVAGIFSQQHADAGSRLLADTLPADLKGRAADFGAGWGYLSVELARRAPGVASVDLFDASFAACVAAKANMMTLAPQLECSVQWRDLLAEPVGRNYDVIVMNPPFHQGRAAEPSIGEGMIRAASAALKSGGRLWLVANRGLPYEAALQNGFARHGEAKRDGQFKVLWAVR